MVALLDELTEHNEFFDFLVDMIPQKLYIRQEPEVPAEFQSKEQRQKNMEQKKAHAKLAKRRKLDPKAATGTVAAQKETVTTVVPLDSQKSRIDALREKLRAKIAEKSQNRPAPDQVSKRAARRAAKQEKKKKQQQQQQQKASKADRAKQYTTKEASETDTPPEDDLQALDFGRLAGLNAPKPYYQANKALANLNKTQNLQKMLQDAKDKQDKLDGWKSALQEADGTRVHNDPKKLQKALKQKARKKEQSQKAWQARTKEQQRQAKDKQKIRQHNLANRKKGLKLSKKKIVEARPGFEGRKQDFLNKGQQ